MRTEDQHELRSRAISNILRTLKHNQVTFWLIVASIIALGIGQLLHLFVRH